MKRILLLCCALAMGGCVSVGNTPVPGLVRPTLRVINRSAAPARIYLNGRYYGTVQGWESCIKLPGDMPGVIQVLSVYRAGVTVSTEIDLTSSYSDGWRLELGLSENTLIHDLNGIMPDDEPCE